MGCISNGSAAPIQFALVSYIPDPLGRFLDRLRLEMVPGCRPRAHVTLLPPRPVIGEPRLAAEELERRAREFVSFDVELGEVTIFEASDVIYLSVAKGQQQLRRMHDALNRGAVAYGEKFPYHPHITLAQDIRREQVQPLCDLARRRWAEYGQTRYFPVEVLAFVRNRGGVLWDDLANIPLAKPEECLVR